MQDRRSGPIAYLEKTVQLVLLLDDEELRRRPYTEYKPVLEERAGLVLRDIFYVCHQHNNQEGQHATDFCRSAQRVHDTAVARSTVHRCHEGMRLVVPYHENICSVDERRVMDVIEVLQATQAQVDQALRDSLGRLRQLDIDWGLEVSTQVR